VRSWSCRRGVLECAGHALSFRCDKRAIAKVPPLGFPLPRHIALGITHPAEHATAARHVAVAAFPVKNRPETGKSNQRSFPTAAGWCFTPARLRLAFPKCAARPAE